MQKKTTSKQNLIHLLISIYKLLMLYKLRFRGIFRIQNYINKIEKTTNLLIDVNIENLQCYVL